MHGGPQNAISAVLACCTNEPLPVLSFNTSAMLPYWSTCGECWLYVSAAMLLLSKYATGSYSPLSASVAAPIPPKYSAHVSGCCSWTPRSLYRVARVEDPAAFVPIAFGMHTSPTRSFAVRVTGKCAPHGIRRYHSSLSGWT